MKNKHKWSAVFALAAMVAMAFGFASCSNTSDNNNLLLLTAMSGGGSGYTVKVALGIEHGTVTADKSKADKDATVTLTAVPAANYVLFSISVTKADGSAVAVSGTENTRTFTMPEGDVTVNALFVTDKVTIANKQSAKGNVSTDKANPTAGETVTLTATPSAANYVLGSISVTKADGSAVTLSGTGNTRTFTMPEGYIIVNVMFIDSAVKYASDFVSTQFYYVKDVQWSTSNPVGTVSSPRMPYYVDEHGEAQSLTDADFTPGSYIKLTKNDGTVDCGNYFGTPSGSKQIPTYTMVLYTAKTDGSGFTQKTIGTNVQILGIEEKGFMAENQTTVRNYGMFFYTQKGWAATSNGTVSLNVNYTGHVYPTLDEIVTYIGTIN